MNKLGNKRIRGMHNSIVWYTNNKHLYFENYHQLGTKGWHSTQP